VSLGTDDRPDVSIQPCYNFRKDRNVYISFVDNSFLEATRLSLKVGQQLPSDVAPYLRRTATGMTVHGTRFLPCRSIIHTYPVEKNLHVIQL